VFGHLLGPRSFDNPKGLLAHKQAFLLLIFSGIGLILMASIAPTTYLGSRAFVILIIAIRFMVNQHHFLLEALMLVNNNTFLFQQHFKVSCDLLLPLACACFLSFEQLIRQQMVRFQNSILEHLHHYTLSNMLFNRIFEAHHAQILSCFGPRAGAWLTI
jgi:hypothetical protein